jgi:protein O-mannosyl-transferase
MLPAALILLAAGTLAYSNSFSGPFVFDDVNSIERNPSIHRLWPPWAPMIDTARPIGAWSFAVNYALGGTNTWGYHAVNLAIHLAAALVLFGIVRRSLLSGRRAARFATVARGLALAVAALWLVHPLQTQGVTYICQRFESLMGLFILLTLYSFIRAQDASRPNRWYAASVACCVLAAATKEAAAVAPLLVLWYDRALVAASWREIVRRRWAYYAGLAGTWALLAGLMASQAHKFADEGLLVIKNLAPWQYALSQPGVIAHYLRLCFWPTGLCLDYNWPVAGTAAEIIPPLLLIAALLAVTAWSVVRWPEWSFVGAWFFLILAPTSSVFPIRDIAFEHRMYLPLAAVATAVVVGGWVAGRWLVCRGAISLPVAQVTGGALVVLAGVTLGVLTFDRNRDYRSALSIWEDTVDKAPGNARAQTNLGLALAECDRLDEAIVHYRIALEINPDFAEAHYDFARALFLSKQTDEAVVHYQAALAIKPDFAEARNNFGLVLRSCGRLDEAIDQFRMAVASKPDLAEAHNNLGLALARKGMLDEPIVQFRAALEIKPDDAEAHANLAFALAQKGRLDEAIVQWQEVIRLQPDNVISLNQLAWMLASRPEASVQDRARAIELAQRAVKLVGEQDPNILDTLAAAYAAAGRFAEAIKTAEQALTLAANQNDTALAEPLSARIKLYQAGSPYHKTQRSSIPTSDHP